MDFCSILHGLQIAEYSIPVPLISTETNKIYEKIVLEIQKNYMNNTINNELEDIIDEMIMRLYPLNKEEKDAIRSFSI